PNHFVMNVTPDQVEPLSALLAEVTDRRGTLYPMVRGRIVAINGTDAATWEEHRGRLDEDGGGSRLSGERNLTWMSDLPPDNRIVAGRWWDAAAGSERALVSLEQEYAEER